MLWFKNKRKKQQSIKAQKIEKEIAVHKKAAKKTVATFKSAANEFNKDFKENGFTVKIFLAAGGKDPKQKMRTN